METLEVPHEAQLGPHPSLNNKQADQWNKEHHSKGKFQHSSNNDSSEDQPPFKLTISDYEEIAQRLECSLKPLQMVRDALNVPENLAPLRERIRQNCEKMTVRVKIAKKHGVHEHKTTPSIVTDVYKAELLDIGQKCFLLLKHARSRKLDFGVEENKTKEASNTGKAFLADKIGLTINAKGEVLLVSSTLTVFRVESDEADSDNFSVQSFELSQKQREFGEVCDVYGDYAADKAQPEGNSINGNGQGPAAASDQFKYLSTSALNHFQSKDLANNSAPSKGQQAPNGITPYMILQPETGEPAVFTSTKQIQLEASKVLSEWSNINGGISAQDANAHTTMNFKDLLSWKIPEHLVSTSARDSQTLLAKKQKDNGYVCSYAHYAHLYKLDLVTQRVKEQKVTFVGIVTHVKCYNENQRGAQKDNQIQQCTSHIDLESTQDKSRVALFVKHSRKIDLKATLQRGFVLVVRDALRKISNQIDIYTQLQFSINNFKVIGQIKEQISDFQADNQITLIKTIPTDKIVRHVLKILGTIVDTQFIKIQYKCDVCRADIANENVCRNGCIIRNPQLNLQVLCLVQDGTSKASLELKNERALTAFNVSEEDQSRFKDYCLRYGTFMNPSSAHNSHYKEVLQVFRRYECWSQLIFYCKPYAKATNEKKNAVFGNQAQAQAQQFQTGYGETIAKPTYIIKEKEREVFLNGEVQNLKKNVGFGEQGRCLKKTVLCLKCLSVDPCLSQEALRITYADRKVIEK